MNEFGYTQQEIELEMIKCSLMLEHPHKSFDEIEAMAIVELKEIYED